MAIIKLLTASRLEGAPSQPYLSKMTREGGKYPFLRETKDGWRVDTDDPSWSEYLKRRQAKPSARRVDIEVKTPKREAGSLSYQAWRDAVFARDSYTCQKCGKRLPPEKLEAHHIKPYSEAPELQFDICNGVALCHDCHVKTDSYGRNKAKKVSGHERKENAEKTKPVVAAKEKRKAVKKAPDPSGSGNQAASGGMTIREAYDLQIILKVQKAEIDKRKAELELGVMEGKYIEKTRMVYLMGYFQRGITEGLDNIRRGETDASAIKFVCDKLKGHVAKIIDILQKEEGLIIPGGKDV